MKVAKSLLLGSATAFLAVAGAQAADLPTRKAAPVQYVKICDAYGAGFFYIPGTETCLRVGGLVLADSIVSNAPNRYNFGSIVGNVTTKPGTLSGLPSGTSGTNSFVNASSRDMYAWGVLGRLELDARTQSPWGTVRSFIRINSGFGSGHTANTGTISNSITQNPAYLGTQAARESTVVDKAFIQFAGITAGRIQSMFDFYADAIGATGLRGSNQTVAALAYSATFGGGFSATLSIEDAFSHRAPIASVVTYSNGFVTGTPVGQFDGTRVPDIVGNLRYDQPWGAIQISGAIHQVRSGLYSGTMVYTGGSAGGQPPASTALARVDKIGWAVQGGLMFNLEKYLSPGDKLWIQATFAEGALGYTSGSNMAFVNGVNTSTNYGVGLSRLSSGNGWNGVGDADCVWTYNGTCDKSKSFAVVAALRHYWTPTISSTLSGSYYKVMYSENSMNPQRGASWANTGAQPFLMGVTNFEETRLATGLYWNPVKAFEIGGEFSWERSRTTRPVGLAGDAALIAAGYNAFRGTADLYRGRIRLLRAF